MIGMTAPFQHAQKTNCERLDCYRLGYSGLLSTQLGDNAAQCKSHRRRGGI
jgi:hypothetical protein